MSESNVVPLFRTAPGDSSFLCCPCQSTSDEGGMLVVVVHDAKGPFICSLVCPACENEIPIAFGRPQE